jgi:hypothetical protein
VQLIGRIRASAANAAQTARARADGSGAQAIAAYGSAAKKEKEAAALTEPSTIDRVVGLYGEAAADYESATSAATESAAFVRSASDAFRRGNVMQALGESEQALARNPNSEPAVKLMLSIRQRAQRAATDARAEAVKQGAEGAPSFKEAEDRRSAAEKNVDPRQARQQVTAFLGARDLYLTAARESFARRTRALQDIAAGRDALRRGELQIAEKRLNDAVLAEPTVGGAANLRTDIEAARRRMEAKAAPPATATPPPASPSPSGRAAAGPPAPAPPATPTAPVPAPRVVDRAAIVDTLKSYATAHEHLDANEVVKVAPYLAGSQQRDLANAFKNLKRFGMRIDPREPTFSDDGMSASVRCTIVREIATKNTGAQPTRTETADVTLSKQNGRWVITKVQSVSSGR